MNAITTVLLTKRRKTADKDQIVPKPGGVPFHTFQIQMLHYLFVFISSFLVDLVPFMGPPAWTVMVFFQARYSLNIWVVLVIGVLGSTLGRYMLSRYIPALSAKIIKPKKNADIQFIGEKLANNGWEVQMFVLLYTLMPLPSTPLFTAAGMARIKPMHILPAFIIGKFTSDMLMVLTGSYMLKNASAIADGFLSWQAVAGTVLGIVIISVFLFIDWHALLQYRRFRLNFHIWK